MINDARETWETIARDVYACRDCRRGDGREASFAATVGPDEVPPEAADSPDKVDVLFVSANPQGLASSGIPDLASYLSASMRTFSKPSGQADRFVRQSLKVLPQGQTWWAADGTPIGNTRACRCPTKNGWGRGHDWAASHCTARFLGRELRALRPRVLVVMGAMPRDVIARELGIHPARQPEAIPCSALGWSGVVVFSRHPSQGTSDAHLAEVRRLVEAALGGEGGVPATGTEVDGSARPQEQNVPLRLTGAARGSRRIVAWQDLPANPRLHSGARRTEEDARPGTTLHVALRLTARPGGATMAEIQDGLRDIGLPKHSALTLVRWLNRDRGWGFTMSPDGRISLVR